MELFSTCYFLVAPWCFPEVWAVSFSGETVPSMPSTEFSAWVAKAIITPNGQESLVKYPGVLCGSEAHTVMKVPRLPLGFRALKMMVFSCVISFICVLCFFDISSVLQKGMRRKDPKAARASDFATSEFHMKLLMSPVFWRASVRQRWCYSPSSFFNFLASIMLCSKVFSFQLSNIYPHRRYAPRSSLQLSNIIDATLWDLLFNFPT